MRATVVGTSPVDSVVAPVEALSLVVQAGARAISSEALSSTKVDRADVIMVSTPFATVHRWVNRASRHIAYNPRSGQ